MPHKNIKPLTLHDPLITLIEAARMAPYSAEYLGLLARKGKLKAIKVGRDWLTTEEMVKKYLEQQVKRHQKVLKSLNKTISKK